jgi:hypothetical protein
VSLEHAAAPTQLPSLLEELSIAETLGECVKYIRAPVRVKTVIIFISFIFSVDQRQPGSWDVAVGGGSPRKRHKATGSNSITLGKS